MVVFILCFKDEEPQEFKHEAIFFCSAFLANQVIPILENPESNHPIQMPETVSLDDFKCLKRWSERETPPLTAEERANFPGPPRPLDLTWWNSLSVEQKKRMLPAAIALKMGEPLINNIRKQLEEENLS